MRPIGQLKRAQLLFLAVREAAVRQGYPLWFIILKARKEGMSTLIEALAFLEARDQQKHALVIAHDDESTKKILQMANRFYEHYKLPQPKRPNPSARAMRFEGREGEMLIQTAGNPYAGTSLTPHFLHASETSKWRRGDEVATSLLQSIQENKETTVVVESTANSYDSLFHPTWENAWEHCRVHVEDTPQGLHAEIEVDDPRFEWNGYIPIFVPWYDDPDYYKPFRSESQQVRFESVLNREQKDYQERFQLSLEQMHWYETTCLKKKCSGDRRKRHQEYPATPEEAFVFSGNPRFDLESINAWNLEPGSRGFLRRSDKLNRRVEFVRDPMSRLVVYRGPRQGHHYVLSCDPAEGIEVEQSNDPDETVLHVYDITTPEGLEQVATVSGQVREEELIEDAHMLHLWFNNAFVLCLQTGGYGQHFNEEMLKKINPTRLYRAEGRLGLKEHVGNKAALVSALADAVRHRQIEMHSEKTAKQFRLYVDQRGRLKASKGHDDHVSAAYAAVHAAQCYPWPLVQGLPDRSVIPGATYSNPPARSGMDEWGGYSPC